VLAGAAHLRAEIVPPPPPAEATPVPPIPLCPPANDTESLPPGRKRQRLAWAKLLSRVFQVDALR
jgi:hypothetical protein